MNARRPRFVQTARDKWEDRLTGRKHENQMPPVLKGFYLPRKPK